MKVKFLSNYSDGKHHWYEGDVVEVVKHFADDLVKHGTAEIVSSAEPEEVRDSGQIEEAVAETREKAVTRRKRGQ